METMMKKECPKKENKILNLVTCYGNEKEVIRYAKSLSKQVCSEAITLVITINKKGELSYQDFIEELDKINIRFFVFDPGHNLGYLNGLLYGYKQYVKNQPQPDWVLMSNTDITFPDTCFFNTFISSEYESDVWCIGPSVFSLDNKFYQNPKYIKRLPLKSINRLISRFENVRIAYLYFILSRLKARLRKRHKYDSRYVYAVQGCFFFLRGEMAEYLKQKEYGALMYGEELYIAEWLLTLQKKCFYDSNIEVIHENGSSTTKLALNKKATLFAKSLRYIRTQFY